MATSQLSSASSKHMEMSCASGWTSDDDHVLQPTMEDGAKSTPSPKGRRPVYSHLAEGSTALSTRYTKTSLT